MGIASELKTPPNENALVKLPRINLGLARHAEPVKLPVWVSRPKKHSTMLAHA